MVASLFGQTERDPSWPSKGLIISRQLVLALQTVDYSCYVLCDAATGAMTQPWEAVRKLNQSLSQVEISKALWQLQEDFSCG